MSYEGKMLSKAISQRFLIARGAGAVAHFLHLDAAMLGLVLLLVGAGTSGVATLHAVSSAVSNLSVSTDARPVPKGQGPSTPGLTPPLAAALDYVAQRYRVAGEALLPIFETVQSVARQRQMDPLLLIAVISIESRFNPISESPMGAQGLMQIIPRYHSDKLTDAAANAPFLDPVTNVQIGAQILQEAIHRQGSLIAGLQYYAGATDDEEQAYAAKVLAERHRLEQAARRGDGANA
jgi:soluble lytic murein transglycosylase-like protein